MSLLSRGVRGHRVTEDEKRIRQVSCFGLGDIGPCESLGDGPEGKHCTGCGCPLVAENALIRPDGKYSKLDYPVLNCPRRMPGFSNYEPSRRGEDRKRTIERLDLVQVRVMPVDLPSPVAGAEDLYERLDKYRNGGAHEQD